MDVLANPLVWIARSPRTLPFFYVALQREPLTKAERSPVLNEALNVRDPRLCGFRYTKVREVKAQAFQVPVCGSTPERENVPGCAILHQALTSPARLSHASVLSQAPQPAEGL